MESSGRNNYDNCTQLNTKGIDKSRGRSNNTKSANIFNLGKEKDMGMAVLFDFLVTCAVQC